MQLLDQLEALFVLVLLLNDSRLLESFVLGLSELLLECIHLCLVIRQSLLLHLGELLQELGLHRLGHSLFDFLRLTRSLGLHRGKLLGMLLFNVLKLRLELP